MKTRSCLTERLLTGRKESNKKNRLSSRCSPVQEMSKVCVLANIIHKKNSQTVETQTKLCPNKAFMFS